MINEHTFLLPASEAIKVMAKSAFMFAMVLVIFVFLGITKSFIDIAIFLLLIHIGLYLYIIRYKYVFISPNYIRGESMFGRSIAIAWSESVNINEISSNGLKGYSLRKSNMLDFVFIPKVIAVSHEFQAVVATYAPENHPLLSISSSLSFKR